MSKSVHSDHRSRMRERYLKNGFDSFADHELLEMALSNVIPRRNTNEIAHRLLQTFGSLNHVLDASVDELMRVEGVGNIVAVALKAQQEITRRYLCNMIPPASKLDTLSEVLKLLYPKFMGETKESVYMVMLNNRFQLMDVALVATGTINQSNVPVVKMVKMAMEKNVPNVIVAHNHPHGTSQPSYADKSITETLYFGMSEMGIQLVEHLVFAEDSYYPILNSFRRDPPFHEER